MSDWKTNFKCPAAFPKEMCEDSNWCGYDTLKKKIISEDGNDTVSCHYLKGCERKKTLLCNPLKKRTWCNDERKLTYWNNTEYADEGVARSGKCEEKNGYKGNDW